MSGDPSGPDKAALVLLALDVDVATQVLSHLSESEVKLLAKRADALDTGAVQALEATFAEFEQLMRTDGPVGARAAGLYFRDLAAKALGEERALLLLAPPPYRDPNALEPMQALRSARTTALAELLQEEHPQLAAVIVAQLPRDSRGGSARRDPRRATGRHHRAPGVLDRDPGRDRAAGLRGRRARLGLGRRAG